MEELFSFGGLLFVALLVYMHLRSKNPANKLDKDGVMPDYAVNTFGHEINQDDFLWVSDLFKQYFPEGNCSISNYSYSKESTGKNILIVSTSIYFMQYYIRNGESENHELMLNGSDEIMSASSILSGQWLTPIACICLENANCESRMNPIHSKAH